MNTKNKPSKLFILYCATRIVLVLSAPLVYALLINGYAFLLRIILGVIALGILGFIAQAFVALHRRDKKFYIICNVIAHTFAISLFAFWGISELINAGTLVAVICVFIVALEIAWLVFLFKSKQIKDRF